jgi:hypothetical protein
MPWWLWLMVGLAVPPVAAVVLLVVHAIRGDWWPG